MPPIAAFCLVGLALLAGCATPGDQGSDAQQVTVTGSERKCQTGSLICRKRDPTDKVQTVSPEVFRDSIGRGSRAPVGGR